MLLPASWNIKVSKLASPAGWGGFRVRRGQIKRISLAIPWTKLYTGAVLRGILGEKMFS